MNLTENIGVLFSELEKIFRTKTVIGEPIVAGNVTLIPIISVSFGAGNGGGDNKDNKGSGDSSGGAAGAGGKITPTAIVVVKDDNVSVLSLSGKSTIDKVITLVPEIIAKVKGQ